MTEIFERKIVEYNNHDMEFIIEPGKNIWINRVIQMSDPEIDGEFRLTRYQSSIDIARKIVGLYNAGDLSLVATLIVAPTQSGKTNITFEICNTMITNYIIPINNIYVITGLSSTSWVKQTCERFPECIKDNIIHRDKLNELFINNLKNKRNILIIIDEIHIASQEDTKLYKALNFIQDINYLYENDIKLIEVSATPDGILSSLKEWNDNSFHIEKYTPDEKYIGVKKLYDNGKILQYKDLMVKKNIEYLNDIIINKYKNNYKYHIIRLPNKKYDIFENFIKENLDEKTFLYIKYDEHNNPGDINNILKTKPLQHTIIFIKEMLRCSKTMYKEYIGILYERYTATPNSSAIIQGLLGRNTGYDVNDESIVFTDLNVVTNYISFIEQENLSYGTVKQWNSRSLKINNEKIIRKSDINTKISKKDISNKVHEDWTPICYPPDYKTKKYTQEEVITGFTQLMFEHGIKVKPQKHKINNGFYLQVIRGSTPKILSINDVENEKKQGINNKNKYRFYACYKDVNDPDTITWIFYYKI